MERRNVVHLGKFTGILPALMDGHRQQPTALGIPTTRRSGLHMRLRKALRTSLGSWGNIGTTLPKLGRDLMQALRVTIAQTRTRRIPRLGLSLTKTLCVHNRTNRDINVM